MGGEGGGDREGVGGIWKGGRGREDKTPDMFQARRSGHFSTWPQCW